MPGITHCVSEALRRQADEGEPTRGAEDPHQMGELLYRLEVLRVEDLLGRAPLRLTSDALAVDLEGRPVLITGAAGSIGSELAHQIALHGPGDLVLFDRDETRLYYIELDLRERFPDLRLTPVVGDITDRVAIDRVFRRFEPQCVYHAAAYKHVPMMETHAREAIRNNVIGTHTVAMSAGERGAQRFVLMSTDKAVHPCSVMGATKRLAELAVLGLQEVHSDTTYCGVRFGNVLGSSGSVLPIFARQLRSSRPLTVTHPHATRYFMTIPEAVQLILHAALLPDIRGNLAILEMGEQVSIVELARNLLRLAGCESRNGNGIVFTGLRPGERLHERLTATDEEARATGIAKVRLVVGSHGDGGAIHQLIPRWTRLVESGNEGEILAYMGRHFPDLRLSPPPVAATERRKGNSGIGSRQRAGIPSQANGRAVAGPLDGAGATGSGGGAVRASRVGAGGRPTPNGADGAAALLRDAKTST